MNAMNKRTDKTETASKFLYIALPALILDRITMLVNVDLALS